MLFFFHWIVCRNQHLALVWIIFLTFPFCQATFVEMYEDWMGNMDMFAATSVPYQQTELQGHSFHVVQMIKQWTWMRHSEHKGLWMFALCWPSTFTTDVSPWGLRMNLFPDQIHSSSVVRWCISDLAGVCKNALHHYTLYKNRTQAVTFW